ncbi:MAG: hypothetical protein MSA90_22185 [Faecalicatena sp.]|uniref:hypothetical protein n=1 Tax=Faecalicatena sp. TaxID=2005360 RepID=UPI00258BBC02|nr:hypothetical protein [Faecalicatena sp.]MCI6468160.1 hypothetical protein [Faecalicatena sp.]
MAEQLLGQMDLFDFVDDPKPMKPDKEKKQTIDILTFLNTGSKHAIKRKWLCYRTGLDDRTMRDLLHEARKKIPVINLQNGKGYFIPDMNIDDDRKLLVRWVKQEESRIKESQLIVETAKKTLSNCGVDWR